MAADTRAAAAAAVTTDEVLYGQQSSLRHAHSLLNSAHLSVVAAQPVELW
jgi:hypothetical protein